MRVSRSGRWWILVVLLGLFAPAAQAKDLRKRLGVGVDGQIGIDASGQQGPASASVKYTFPSSDKTINIQVEGLIGFNYADSAGLTLVTGGRFLYTVVAEDHLNLFLGSGLAFVREPGATTQENLVRIQPIAGVEFFMFGLDNLGFTASVGLNADIGLSPTAGFGVGTTLASAGNLGIHYYF